VSCCRRMGSSPQMPPSCMVLHRQSRPTRSKCPLRTAQGAVQALLGAGWLRQTHSVQRRNRNQTGAVGGRAAGQPTNFMHKPLSSAALGLAPARSPVGMPSSLLPRPNPLTTAPRRQTGASSCRTVRCPPRGVLPVSTAAQHRNNFPHFTIFRGKVAKFAREKNREGQSRAVKGKETC